MEVTQKPRLHQDWIDSHAYGIVKALQKGGFTTYLVGGCVRDLLLGIHPKDFDIATMAHPPQVKRLIYMSYIIGKRFRLVLVKRDEQQFEVATFRREIKAEDFPEGMPMGDNVFGTPEEDARRRDFTINGLFYDPVNQQLIDFTEGLNDIKERVIRMIGDPNLRLIEDPIRILRALRLSHKLGFQIDPDLRQAISTHASELLKSVLPRKREEILKILRLQDPSLALLEAFDLGVLKYWIPTLDQLFQDPRAQDEFFMYFRQYQRMSKGHDDPVHLFGWLVFSYFRTVVNLENEKMAEHEIIEREEFQTFMRDELGLYKFEQSTVARALEVLSFLPRTDDFKKRGERRQHALLRNEGFSLALEFADADYLLSPEQIIYWRKIYQKALPQLREEERELKDSRRKRRRPRRRTDHRADGANLDDSDGRRVRERRAPAAATDENTDEISESSNGLAHDDEQEFARLDEDLDLSDDLDESLDETIEDSASSQGAISKTHH